MHTNEFVTATTADIDATPPIPDQPSRKPTWPTWATQSLVGVKKTSKNVQRFIETDPSGAAALVGTAIGITVTILLVLSIGAKMLQWVITGNPVHDVAAQLPVIRIATDPIGHWLSLHTAGLPLTTTAAAWTWGATGFLLFYAATYRHLGAQLLWPTYGAATAAMAWLGTDTAAYRPVVVGLLAAAWSVLSLLALRGRRRRTKKS